MRVFCCSASLWHLLQANVRASTATDCIAYTSLSLCCNASLRQWLHTKVKASGAMGCALTRLKSMQDAAERLHVMEGYVVTMNERVRWVCMSAASVYMTRGNTLPVTVTVAYCS